MRRYVGDYFADHSGVRNLVTSAESLKNASPDQQFYAMDESISDIKFTYDLNKADIETDEAKQDLRRVIQWLIINTDVHVQINGFADEGEFTRAYNDTVMKFIDSTATFHKAMPDAIKKGYLRIEMMRAMKIAKALYEAGITEDRISGTSMVFTSDTKEAAAANRKCTLTFEKMKPRVSLYEYHFGKKKPEKAN
jgi:outer membrane protein OmpA-like peptidoglycan-associated protein